MKEGELEVVVAVFAKSSLEYVAARTLLAGFAVA